MKMPFVTKEKMDEIISEYPTPFHLYHEEGIRKNAQKTNSAFAWNPFQLPDSHFMRGGSSLNALWMRR